LPFKIGAPVGRLATESAIADAEQQRALRKPPENLRAWETYQTGLWHQARFNVTENMTERDFFKRAVERDPDFSRAYQGLV
jgi:adenylate cyclase